MALTFDNHGVAENLPVVFLHGFPFNRALWNSQAPLAGRYRLIFPDLPGFGASPIEIDPLDMTVEYMADQVAALLDDLEVEKAIVMGHSMGGYVALAFAENYPHRLSGLGLICSHAAPDSDAVRQNRMNMIEMVRREGPDSVAGTIRTRLFSSETEVGRPGLLQGAYAIMKDASKDGIVGALSAMAQRPDRRPLLSDIDVDTLIVTGAMDRILPAERITEMTDNLKHPKLVTFPSSGHLPMLEEHESFNYEVETFLAAILTDHTNATTV